ncbi:MAG: hypothetical protein AUH84_02040 [Thaumarchaeota archaeon 13_1_40CM_4_38_7]|nr:MAG: hypothetical protein AUH84_02040 [Thaumarchaeota archaeon 13_1_40CM_4_38_7]OLC93050.1 MAG: hypothetical protein AUI92_03755 [Thaumarchaeota archaeon 13_1_40CM_3_38_6]OLD40629.1 MAG: hypothetical protein AUI60_04025 [Thaumarchaeota archaeon 13_1_40CM_2_39_4]
MANYRREISKYEQKDVHSKYRDLVDKDGGIFTKDKRRKLLGLKQEHGKYFQDTADFWYDVRQTVANGLKDLELFFEVAHQEQIKEVLHDSPIKEEVGLGRKYKNVEEILELSKRIPTLKKALESLFKDYRVIRRAKLPTGQKYSVSEPVEKEDSWKALLAEDIVNICMEFFMKRNLISTKAHLRLVEELQDMLDVEVSRTFYLKRDQRTKGHV